jgi:hypothetical protein
VAAAPPALLAERGRAAARRGVPDAAMRSLLAFLAAAASGCVVARHDDFATPQDAVLTFQSAFARDDEFREYDCFSHEMREEQGLTQRAWSTARDLVFEPLGCVGRFVLRRNSLEDNLVAAGEDGRVARLDYEIFGHALSVALVPELAVDFLGPDGSLLAGLRDPRIERLQAGAKLYAPDKLPVDGKIPQGTTLHLLGELPFDAILRVSGCAEVVLRREWRIRAVAVPDAQASPLPQPLSPPRPARRLASLLGNPPLEALGVGLGVRRVRVGLPMEDGPANAILARGPWGLEAPLQWKIDPEGREQLQPRALLELRRLEPILCTWEDIHGD